MVDFRSQGKHEHPKVTRDYRTTALIDASELSVESRNRLAQELDKAVYKASANYPSVTHYFVKLLDTEITVGLQLEKVEPGNVESIAAALIDESLAATTRSLNLPSPVEIEESDLYLV